MFPRHITGFTRGASDRQFGVGEMMVGLFDAASFVVIRIVLALGQAGPGSGFRPTIRDNPWPLEKVGA